MSEDSTHKNWYADTRGSQGLVYDEDTGKNIAVSYETGDAPLIAAAPALLNALHVALSALQSANKQSALSYDEAKAIRVCEDAINQAKGQ